MILIVFLNKYDKQSHLMGKEVPSYLKGDYVKIYTRYPSKVYEQCTVKNTIKIIKEYCKVFDSIMVSFGLRIFPPSAYKDLINKYSKFKSNLVFLKVLYGSKTWALEDKKLKFDNRRISDAGLFIIQAQDILNSKATSFNTLLKELLRKNKLSYKFISYWLTTNKRRI